MKSTNLASMAGRTDPAIEVFKPTPRKSVVRKLVVACLALTIATAPVTAALAEGGFMVIQYEVALAKTPKFRQLNLVYQDDIGAIESFDLGQEAKANVVIPLYSMNPGAPGIFNRLNAEQTGEEDGSKGGIREVLGVLLGLGVIALYAYAAAECFEDIGDQAQNSAACEAL